MANNKYTTLELEGLSMKELSTMLAEEQTDYKKLKFAHKITPLENPNLLKETRRNIARLKTQLRAKELAEQN